MTETYKIQFVVVFVCILLSAIAITAVSLSLRYLLDDFILPLIGQKEPNFAELYQALAVLGCIFLVGVIVDLYLYPNDGIYRSGCVKESKR